MGISIQKPSSGFTVIAKMLKSIIGHCLSVKTLDNQM
jgi:hypothetical protein